MGPGAFMTNTMQVAMASRAPRGSATQRLLAPASTARCHRAMASPVVTKPSKFTPTRTGISVMLKSTRPLEGNGAPSADPDELVIRGDRAGQRLEAGRGDPIHVLDVKAHASRDHIERFHRAGDVGLQHHGPGFGDVGLFMDGLADAVAEEFERGLDAAVAQVCDVSAIEVRHGGAG